MSTPLLCLLLSLFTTTAPTEIYTLSLHDALPISVGPAQVGRRGRPFSRTTGPTGTARSATCCGRCASIRCRGPRGPRSEEHTSELQSRFDLVCRLLLEKKKK